MKFHWSERGGGWLIQNDDIGQLDTFEHDNFPVFEKS